MEDFAGAKFYSQHALADGKPKDPVNKNIITGSIARSANLPVFSLLRGRF